MRVATLGSLRGSIGRDVSFSYGVFTAEGIGEMGVEDLREADATGQLTWISDDLRTLVLGYSPEPAISLIDTTGAGETRRQLAIETEVVYVPPHRVGSKTEAELGFIVADMVERGWILVEDSRIGAAGGHLTFQRAEPIDSELLASLSYAG